MTTRRVLTAAGLAFAGGLLLAAGLVAEAAVSYSRGPQR